MNQAIHRAGNGTNQIILVLFKNINIWSSHAPDKVDVPIHGQWAYVFSAINLFG